MQTDHLLNYVNQDDAYSNASKRDGRRRKFGLALLVVGTVALCGSLMAATSFKHAPSQTQSLSEALTLEQEGILTDTTSLIPYEEPLDGMLSLAGEDATYMPNIDLLVSGYNIFKGDPLANHRDPGFSDG